MEMIICGIDESGRGAVIGSIYIAIACVEESKEKELINRLTRSKERDYWGRKTLLTILKKYINFSSVKKIEPSLIDMFVKDAQLLEVMASKTSELIVEAYRTVLPKVIYIDSPSQNMFQYRKYVIDYLEEIEKGLSKAVGIYVDIGLDKKKPVVKLAELVARVSFDEEILQLKKKYGDFGSGYPSDEKTRRWLEKLKKEGKLREIPEIRKTWSTLDTL